jgi:peptidoglycan/LPS O-acetylase OafA/YrhL
VIVFLGIALVVWPIWLPLSLRLAERRPAHRRVLAVFLFCGVVVAVSAAMLISRWQPVAMIGGHSIRYDRAGGGGGIRESFVLAGYIIPTILPLFVSTVELAPAIGVALAGSLALTAVIETNVFTSVWCFFAAILSGMVLLSVVREGRRSEMNAAT